MFGWLNLISLIVLPVALLWAWVNRGSDDARVVADADGGR